MLAGLYVWHSQIFTTPPPQYRPKWLQNIVWASVTVGETLRRNLSTVKFIKVESVSERHYDINGVKKVAIRVMEAMEAMEQSIASWKVPHGSKVYGLVATRPVAESTGRSACIPFLPGR